jgi:predicted transcriptional regulator
VTTKTKTIEVDEATAMALEERAGARGISVPDLLAEYLGEDRQPVDVDRDQIAELDRRWANIEAGQPTVSHEKVVRWLETWGTTAYRPWRDQ